MFFRVRSLAVFLLTIFALAYAFAQTVPVAPAPTTDAVEAQKMLMQAEGHMKVAAFEEATSIFRTILKRYPNMPERYQAQYRMSEALFEMKKDNEGVALLQAMVNEAEPDWSPKALSRIGEFYKSKQKYQEAINAYRKVISDFPDSTIVDRAHFSIGIIYLQQGRYEPAVNELDKVGTALATRSPDQLRVAPGDPLIVRMREPNLVAHEVLKVPVEVTITAAKSGDVVKSTLLPESADSDRFNVVVQTQLGTAKADDKVLQLFGDDVITLSYKTHYLGKAPETKTVKILTASNAQITLRDSDLAEVAAIAVGEKLTVDVNDADCDVSEGLDTLTVVLTTKQNDSETVTLTETGAHTGIFRGAISIANGKAKPNSGVIETEEKKDIRGERAEDGITVTYNDKLVLFALPNAEKTAPTYIPMVNIASGELSIPQKVVNDPNLGIQTMIYKGKSLTEIGTTYLDLGQQLKAERSFRGAEDQFLGLMTKYPKAPEVEEAMYGLVRNYMAQDNYPSAMSMIDQLLAKYPQSVHATDALMQMADANVKLGKYSEALVLYAKLVKAGKNGPIAENAQYAICNTYQTMFNVQRVNATVKLLVTVDTVIAAYEDFTISYPASEKSPDILNKLVDLQYANDDYTGVVSTARRLVARYPDSSLCGPALLRAADAQLKLGDTEGAAATCRSIIANYGNEADAAAKILNKAKPPVTTATTTGKVN